VNMPERYDALLCVWNKCGIIKNKDWSDGEDHPTSS
jgi:hypothetical protein